jgi:hypothetical protein
MLRAIAQAKNLRFRLTTVASDVAPEQVVQALYAGQLQPIGPMAKPTEADILQCSHIVGQCGTETLARALREPTDVLIAGRACDTAVFAVLPDMLGYPVGLCQHMAKIIECTSLCCSPSARDAMLAELDMDGFTLESMNPQAHATPASVAAHALYEQADPFEVDEPTGTLLLQQAQYQALDAHRTRVSGAQWRPRAQATLKIEGAARVGERCVLLAGVADPTLLAELNPALQAVEARVRQLVPGDWALHPHIYGQGAVRPLPPAQHSRHEAGLVLEFIAPSADLARTAAGVFKQNLLHHGFPGRLCSAGNLAFAFTPSELDAGTAYRFVLYHVMQAAPLADIFKIDSCTVAGSPSGVTP